MSQIEFAHGLINHLQRGNVLATDCPSREILSHLTGRWGTLALIVLMTGTYRFSELRRKMTGVSERMLAQTLQQLEADGFVTRTAHNVVPPHVDYCLTPLGHEAAEHIAGLVRWIEESLPNILQGSKLSTAAA